MSHINRSISFGFAILFILAGCGGGSGGSGGSGGGGGVSGAVTTALATGTWKSPCILDDEDPLDIVNFIIEIIIDATTITGTVTIYDQADTTCTAVLMAENLDFTYTLGGNVTVDGSVAGITTATKIDITDPGPPIEIDYELIAILNDKLYLGNADGVNDGTSDALRPTQLDGSEFFTRQ